MLQQFLNWFTGSIPGGIILFLIPLLLIWLLVYFLVKMESLDKLTLILSGLIATFIWFFNFYSLRQNYLPIPDPKRILVFPFTDVKNDSDFVAYAFWDKLTQNLNTKTDKNWIAYKTEWVSDSFDFKQFGSTAYLKNYAKKVDADLIVYGILVPDSSGLVGELIVETLQEEEKLAVKFEPFILSSKNFSETAEKFSEKIITQAKIENQNPKYNDSINEFYKITLPQEEFYQAKFLFFQKHFEQARKSCRQFLEKYPDFPPALILLGEINLALTHQNIREDLRGMDNFYSEGRKILVKLNQKIPKSLEYWFFKVKFHATYKEWQTVEEYLKMLLKEDQTNADFYRILYSLSSERWQNFKEVFGKIREATQILDRMVTLNPCSVNYRLLYSDYYLEKKILDEFSTSLNKGEKYLVQADELNPNHIPALMKRGRFYLLKKELGKALEFYHRVVTLDPNHTEAYYNLGVACYRNGQTKEAEKFFLKAIQVNNHLDSHFYLASIYYQKNEKEKALKLINKRITLSPGPSDKFIENARDLKILILKDDTKEVKTELPEVK
ncbi:tetratricopeptide repeat protein [bacterium]|nr:tetratricopeptide repeat protein [bacterium]